MRIVSTILLSLLLTFAAYGQQNLQVGQPAPDFVAQTIDGQTINLKDFQGKVVMLTFWSTKCEICHSEIPKMNQIVDRYKGKDVVFLALTMENEAKVNPYLRKNPFNYTILTNGFGVVLKYANMSKDGGINMGFPSYFLINKQGAIHLRSEGWDKTQSLDNQISRLLTE
ncbi:MAG: TlpA family protein disulfide reductase [Pyrinomonadaceae bacterium]